MCNVIYYYFSCAHSLRRRRSQCSGTKHKITRTSTKAACTAESFLTIYVRLDCGSCQLGQWEQAWMLKLQRAKSFRDKLQETSLPAYEEIANLVKELENEYIQASWDTRTLFAPVVKRPVARVCISEYTKARSPLAQEVLPEDVLEPRMCKEWADMDDDDYDGDYVASTDPIHPVSTDYSHPMDDDDGSWVLQHLADGDEDEVTGSFDSTIEFEGAGWSWDEEVLTTMTGDLNEDTNNIISRAQATDIEGNTQGLMAWGPEAAMSSSFAILSMSGALDKEQLRREQVAEVVRSFWSVVDGDHQNPLIKPTPSPEVPKIFDNGEEEDEILKTTSHALNITPTYHFPADPMTPPPSAPPSPKHLPTILSMDGPSDTPPTSPITLPSQTHLPQTPPAMPATTFPPPDLPKPQTPTSPPRPTTPPSPNSTRAYYDKYRKHLRSRRSADPRKYYSDWLTVARYEVRAFEGPEGRRVCDPPVLREGCGRGTGWWR